MRKPEAGSRKPEAVVGARRQTADDAIRHLRRTCRPVLLAILCLGPIPQVARSQTTADTRAAILLTLPASSRALGLGDAWGAVADDESALFYNPAQLARVRALAVGGSMQNYIASSRGSARSRFRSGMARSASGFSS